MSQADGGGGGGGGRSGGCMAFSIPSVTLSVSVPFAAHLSPLSPFLLDVAHTIVPATNPIRSTYFAVTRYAHWRTWESVSRALAYVFSVLRIHVRRKVCVCMCVCTRNTHVNGVEREAAARFTRTEGAVAATGASLSESTGLTHARLRHARDSRVYRNVQRRLSRRDFHMIVSYTRPHISPRLDGRDRITRARSRYCALRGHRGHRGPHLIDRRALLPPPLITAARAPLPLAVARADRDSGPYRAIHGSINQSSSRLREWIWSTRISSHVFIARNVHNKCTYKRAAEDSSS